MKTLTKILVALIFIHAGISYGQTDEPPVSYFEEEANHLLGQYNKEKIAEISDYLEKLNEFNDQELSEEQMGSLAAIRQRFNDFGENQKSGPVYFIFKKRGNKYYWLSMGLSGLKIKYLGKKSDQPLNKGISYSVSHAVGQIPIVIVSNDYAETVNINPITSPIILLGAGATIEDAGPAFKIENVPIYSVISGFYIRNCNSDFGGGVKIMDSNIIFLLNYLQDNHASGMGGGIYCRNGVGITSFIVGNVLLSNHAPAGGGLAFHHDLSTIAALNQMRSNNAAIGGGAYFDKSLTSFMFNIIYNNNAVDGGGIAVDQSYFTNIGVNVINANQAGNRGGGIFITGQDTIPSLICFNAVTGNTAGQSGGGIAIDNDCDAIILLNYIDNNNAQAGGGVAIDQGDVNTTLLANLISCNHAVNGGGIWLFDVQNTNGAIGVNRIYNNIADVTGGGICIFGDLTNSWISLNNKISHNTSPVGGGIYISGFNIPQIRDNEIYLNTSNLGAGIFCQGGTTAEIINNDIFQNCAEEKGGGIYVTGLLTDPKIKLANEFLKNYAKKGGGIYLDNLCNPLISGNDFLKNQAEEGGAIFANTDAFQILSNLFKWNHSVFNGGGIFINPGMSPEIKSNLFEYNIAGKGTFSGCSKTQTGDIKAGPYNGGAVFMAGANTDPKIHNNNFKKNAASNGGALSIEDNANPEVKDNYFYSNLADFDTTGNGCGGAIHISNASPLIEGDSLIWNYAVYGGGIACLNGAKPQITSSNFRWNIADYKSEGEGIGGAIYVSGEGTEPVIGLPDMSNLFKENIAEQGGAIAADLGAVFDVQSNWFFSNHTDFNEDGSGNGGALFATDSGTDLVVGGNAIDGEDNLFEYNTAGSPGFPGLANGGAIAAVKGAVLTILGNTFDNRNACTNNGGAVYLEGDGTYALIGGQNDDEIINTPQLNEERKDLVWVEQLGNIIRNNNRSLKKQISLPEIDWPEEPEPDTVSYTYETPPPFPDTIEVPHYEPFRDSYITTIQPDYLPPYKYTYITDNAGGLQVLNVTNPLTPVITATFPSNDQSTDVCVSGNLIFVADGSGGIKVIDKSPMYAGLPPVELYTLVFADVAIVEVEADLQNLYALGDDNTLYFGKIFGNTVNLNGSYTPLNPDENLTGICAANNYLYLSMQMMQDALFMVSQVIPGDPPFLELFPPVAFPMSSIVDIAVFDFNAYLAMNQRLGEEDMAMIMKLEVIDPNMIIILGTPIPPVPDQLCYSAYVNASTIYLTLNDSFIRYDQITGMQDFFPSTSLISDLYEDAGFVFLGNTGEGLQICEAFNMMPVITMAFAPVYKEKEINLYTWVSYPPEEFFMDLPPLPDTVIIPGVGEPLKSTPRGPYNQTQDIFSQVKDLYKAIVRETDTLITINGGFLAVVDTAETRVLGNLIGGSSPFVANYATEKGGGIYVKNAGTMVHIGESETKEGDQKNFIIGNLADKGGGIAVVNHDNILLIENNIIGGAPEFHSNVAGTYGGGFYSWKSKSILTGNIIQNNYSGIEKDKLKPETGFGGGLALDSSNTQINNNWIIDNFSFGNAGGIGIMGGKTVLKQNTLTENKGIRSLSRVNQQAMGVGDDFYAEALSDSCILSKNVFDHVGSFEAYSIYVDTVSSTGLSKLEITENNVWNTTGKRYGGFRTEPTGSDGNISVNPLFVDPENDNFNLDINSPCNSMGWNPDPGNTVVGDTTYWVPDDFSTITAAMNAAIYGDIIKVRKNYSSQSETFPINVKSGVFLTGLAFKEDSLNLNLTPETILRAVPETNILQLDSTDDRTIIAGLRLTAADTAITINNGSAFIYGNIFDSIAMGIKMRYNDTTQMGFNDNVFVDHNTFSDGHIDIEYDSLAANRAEIGQVKMHHGPIISYNIGSVFCNLDSIASRVPFHLVFETNDFWPNGITGCNQDVYGLSSTNFQNDPLFHDELNKDFHLDQASPCLLTNNYTYLVGAQYQYIDVDFSGDPVEGWKPLTVTFSDSSSTALPPLNYFWAFGDSQTDTAHNPTHIYPDTGTYDVSFTVQDRYAYKTELKTGYIKVLIPRHDLSIPEGWSGVSTFIVPVPDTLPEMFAPVEDELIILFNLGGVYWPGQNVNTIGHWDAYNGYVIKVTEDVALSVTGEQLDSRSVVLNQGWNLIPVFTQSSAPALLGSLPGFVVAKGVANAEILWPNYNIATLQTLNTGKSYFVYTTQSGTISYAKSTSSGIVEPPELILETPWNEIIRTPYTHLVAFTAECLKVLEPGDMIAAFNSTGLCVGASVVGDFGDEVVLILFGDDPTTEIIEGYLEEEPVTLKCFRQSTGEVFDLEVKWEEQLNHSGLFETHGLSAVTDIKVGSTGEVLIAQRSIKIYPNPSKGTFTISGLQGECSIVIVNAVGNEVFEKQVNLPANIDISNQPNGIYLIIITAFHDVILRKLVIN
ncbi:MAG: PKD domain-containing protein [Bacteroidales bacterium]|nr:PKD domain-containing protein [Bacteroidales bacterium]